MVNHRLITGPPSPKNFSIKSRLQAIALSDKFKEGPSLLCGDHQQQHRRSSVRAVKVSALPVETIWSVRQQQSGEAIMNVEQSSKQRLAASCILSLGNAVYFVTGPQNKCVTSCRESVSDPTPHLTLHSSNVPVVGVARHCARCVVPSLGKACLVLILPEQLRICATMYN